MNLNIDEQMMGIRHPGQMTGHPSPLSSFAVSHGAGAGTGRIQDVISVDLTSGTRGTDAYAGKKSDLAGASAQGGEKDRAAELNAMIVLSHTLSGEDYARAMEDGYQPGESGSGETVTIMDRIKTALLQSGNEVAGFTDDIDPDKLAKITGSDAYASALARSFSENDLPADDGLIKEASDAMKQAQTLTQPDDAAVKYMVENRMDPTIRNFYLAESATNGANVSATGFYAQEGGYLARKADEPDFEKLESQIDAVVERAGYTTEEAGEEARWIVANDLPLEEENLNRVMDITRTAFPVEVQTAADAAASALADGKAALDGNLSDPVSANRRAALLMQREELEEARLYMSAEVNRRLLDKGISIDTLPMEQLIEELKTAREEIAGEWFPGVAEESDQGRVTAVEKYDLFGSTLAQTAVIRHAPIAFVGAEQELLKTGTLTELAARAGEFTADHTPKTADEGRSAAADASGAKQSLRFAEAAQTYEAVGTQVRADLGDSIRKAFGNVDDILRGLDLETSADNERAVRILGYNRMEITQASVEEIRAQDAKLRDVTERLKPGAVLSMIRDGVNPLKLTLDELKQELDERGEQGDTPAEKYAKFLWKLEKNGEVTEEERTSYIGIYRLFHTLKKTDHAAIGTLLNEGAQMTIGNLLSATRSAKTAARGMDARVDDSFGGMDGSYKTPSISAQIETAFSYYRAKADSVYEHLDADRLAEAKPTEETTLPALAEALEEQAQSESGTDRAFARVRARQIREQLSGEAAERAAQELKENELPVTPHMVEAMRALQKSRRRTDSVWDALEKLNGRNGRGERIADEKTLTAAMETIEDALSDGAHFEEVYKDKTQEMAEDLDHMMEETETTIDLQTMILAKRQLTVACAQADRGSFDIPVELDGERVNLHVSIRESREEGSTVTAQLPTADHGVLTLSLGMAKGQVTGMLNTSENRYPEADAFVTGVRDRFTEAAATLTEGGIGEISLLFGALPGREMQAKPVETMDGSLCFRLARTFVEAAAQSLYAV
ncbi:MAG: DUF6240 domain-containing protein [Lachnospiraceae bacterium]|nr:DUF6240 domain-containing protein [Lachnospiraceae bacterium]